MKTYKIPETLLNKILQNLGGQPYIQVADIIREIDNAVRISNIQTEDKDDGKD